MNLTANLMDMYVLDTTVMMWKDLSYIVTGEKPSPRDSIGIATVSKKIYIFGGVFRKGVLNLICLLVLYSMFSLDSTLMSLFFNLFFS
jgi:hypothetical protein